MDEKGVVHVDMESLMLRPATELAEMSMALIHGVMETQLAMLQRVVVEIDDGKLDLGMPSAEILDVLMCSDRCDGCGCMPELVRDVTEALLAKLETKH